MSVPAPSGADVETLDAWRDAGRVHFHRGHAIFYRDVGEGEALLLVHGFPTASWDWHRVLPALARRFRVVAPDLVGFGFSAKPLPYDYAIHDQADLCEGLLGALGIARAHVLAHDYGDTVAQELVARHDARLAAGKGGLAIPSLALLNGGLFPETHRPRPIQRLLLSPLGPLVALASSRRTFGRSLAAVFGPRTQPTERELDDFYRLLVVNDGKRVLPSLIRYMVERRVHRERWVSALARTSIPTRLIDGPEDPVSGAHMVARYRELVPEPDVVLLPGIGHYPQVEDPDGVLRAYFEHVDGRAAGRPGR